MKRMTLLVVTLLAITSTSLTLSAAQAETKVLSTLELKTSCALTQEPEHRAFCIGYMSATYDTYLVTRHPDHAKPFICPSQPAPTRDEVIAGFVDWSNANTQYDSEPAADNVLRYLGGRFPCKK